MSWPLICTAFHLPPCIIYLFCEFTCSQGAVLVVTFRPTLFAALLAATFELLPHFMKTLLPYATISTALFCLL